ncbi:putative actin cytoskeleton organization protein [Phaeomoniella chlamydospora]|uniref:Putative actin cytoskeleton organization protein n=1 Tax=Phaeomoniella chlamydospora TaxID=158046 RepID=A0A0G2EDF8_PHACM|nr:putative actin cytoskeleton organization protein [Phaeomoniella chlamydospora]
MLATEAVGLASNKDKEAASKLREAIALGPDNSQVRSALQQIEKGQGGELVNLCWRYVSDNDDKAAEDMLTRLRDTALSSGLSCLECLRLILEKQPSRLSTKQDELIGKLALSTTATRELLAKKFQSSPTECFDNMYDRGSESVNCLRAVVVNASSWKTSSVQATMKEDLFQLLLAKLMESGHEHDARALRNIALLIAADPQLLSKLVDEDSFDAILSSLDFRLPEDVKSSALLSISKYLEVAQDEGQKYFTNYVVAKLERQRKDDMLIAFSAAAAVFPIAQPMTASLFLTEGFLPSIMPLFNTKFKNPAIITAFLKLLNAAAMDEACRGAIIRHCSDWLSYTVSNGSSDDTPLAATVLAKIRTGTIKQEGGDAPPQDSNVDELVKMFKNTLRTSSRGPVATSIEGLAYTSLKPEVKEAIGHDSSLLGSLFQHIKDSIHSPDIVIGGLSIISNLTQYQPNLTDEQKKMAELKAYANTSKLPSLNPLNDEQHTTARCAAVVDAGVLPLLVDCNTKSKSASTKQLISNILLSLSKDAKSRGKIAQQGAVRLLLQMLGSGESTSSAQPLYYFPAAHALARILISTNPTHIFTASGNPSAGSAVRPLTYLLEDSETRTASSPLASSSSEPRTLLPTFESLLALTNLASYPDPTPATLIVRLAFDKIEDLLLSSHRYLQRAACELVCNLMATEAGLTKYADTENDPRAKSRIHLLLALCDVEDLQTRKAAGGGLAMLTEFPTAVSAVLDKEAGKGIENLFSLCADDDEDARFRGLVCLRNLTYCEGEVGGRAQRMVKEKDGIDQLKECLRQTKSPGALQSGVEALKKLV